MENIEEYNEDQLYDIHKLSAERNRRLNRYKNRNLSEPEILMLHINFTLTNVFWGNSWSCNEVIKIRKGSELKTSVNVQSSHTLSEVWDCKVIYYNNEEDHNIYFKSLENDLTIQIYNNNLTCSCDESHELEGHVAEKQLTIDNR